MTSSFARAQAFVARMEGGFVNHPSDPGGATNHGISLRFLQGQGLSVGDIDHDGDIDADDIRALTPETAAAILRKNFWEPLKLDMLPDALALVLYDTSVNMGPGTARRLTQQALGVEVDGKWGPKTWAALMRCNGAQTARAVIRLRHGSYTALVANNRKLEAFYTGWMHRLAALEKELLTY